MSINNNIRVKSIVSDLKTKYGNQSITNNSSNNSNDSSIVDNIIVKVKNKLSNNLKYILGVALPIILLLFYLLYNYNLTSRTRNVIDTMSYKEKIKNTPLNQCYQIDVKYQFKLCDYYISSSFMTPCVGNQHYDYVSIDMIIEVIQSGARYIQIPICEADVGPQALPVIGTAEYGQKVITSINTLDIQNVFKTIRLNAFKLNKKPINYPLIIHLILNTTNTFTLNVVSDNIKDIFGDLLVDVSKYKTFPIFLEKLCNLLDKIIIIATPEYIGTKLETYIVPLNKLFNIYQFSELASISIPKDTLYTKSYHKKLSTKHQTKSSLKFKNKYPSIDYIVKNASTINKTIINDEDILNNLTSFNKIGMSLVKPHYSADVSTQNYDTTEAIYLGCQFVAMNFQINDVYMKKYIEIFKDSSFRLKPSSMRFTEKEEPIKDLLSIYETITKQNNNILNDFYYKYGNKLISFESYTLINNYLTQVENYLKFNLGGTTIKSQYGDINYKLNISQCFIPRKSAIGGSENISLYLESVIMPGFYITLNGNSFNLQELSEKKKDLINQAFYVEKPKTIDDEYDTTKGEMISIRTFSNDNPLYLAYENKHVKAYGDSPQIQAKNNMTFFIKEVKYQTIIKIITLSYGSLKTIGDNIIGVIENNVNNGTSYIVIPTNQSGNSFNIFKDQFMLKNKEKQTYVIFDEDTGFLYNKDLEPSANSIFRINPTNGYYSILNVRNEELILFNKNLIKFTEPKNVLSNENLFKLDITYELLD